MEDIELKVFETDDRQEELILEPFLHFWACEPTFSAIPELRSEKGRATIAALLKGKGYTRNAPLVVAWDKRNSKAAGFFWHQVLRKDDDGKMKTRLSISSGDWAEVTMHQLKGALEFYGKIRVKTDVFNRFGIHEVWKMVILAVSPEYSGKGIGQRLMERSLQLAVEKGFPVAISNFSSKYTQKIARKCGFEVIVEEPYTKETYSNFDNMSPEIVETHQKCLAMAKKLQAQHFC